MEQERAANFKNSAPDGGAGPLPSVSLPKGGGAIRGIGEKFGVNPVTGTGTLSIPVVTSSGRSGVGPQLSLSYDSGAGNGPFGFGWSLSLPSVTRKTDKGLPRYCDAEESDVFIVSGAEDLVPVLDANGQWVQSTRTVHGVTYNIRFYRPRVEGLFARIERWVAADSGLSHWRSITRDNVTTLYGVDANSRIVDPADPRKIFSYLICRTFDDKGNVVVYEYAAEDGTSVHRSQAHEANRTDADRAAQRYLKRVRYGSGTPYFPVWSPDGAETPLPSDWHFELVLDYGDHALDTPTPDADRARCVRPDPFSTYRAGFEVRTYRRCERVLMFHHFAAESDVGTDCLVRSTDFSYSDEHIPPDPRSPIYTFLQSVTQAGYRRRGTGYLRKPMPRVEFEYSQPQIQPDILTLDGASVTNLPEGLGGSRYQWVDLDGEGLSGILSDVGGDWTYKRNLSPLNQTTLPDGRRMTRPFFAPLERVSVLPSRNELGGGQQLLDLAGDGRLDLVTFDDPAPGFFDRRLDEGWEPFRTFASLPRVDWSDPNLRFVDLTGNGLADILLTEDGLFTFYPSLGEAGFGEAERVRTPWDEDQGPNVVFADATETVFLADMSGDGLSDMVRVRNGEVCYWPNLGYGRFGAKVTMSGAPRFDNEERFDPRRVRLADIDGSGTTDLLYIGHDGVQVCFNRSGNSWGEPHRLAIFPTADNLSPVQVADLLGNGTACLVWSSPQPAEAGSPVRYVDLMGGQKPHLMVRVRNNLGAETVLRYAPSTQFYLMDKRAATPWITKLPFPVHVVERVEIYDRVSRNRFVTRYAYHHGYFDGYEREFRGFGMIEQWDTEEFAALSASDALSSAANVDAPSHIPPVCTKTWFHTGAYLDAAFSVQLKDDYYREPGLSDAQFDDQLLGDTILPPALAAEEQREACRALKGSILRQEIYAFDNSIRSEHPYTVSERNYSVRVIQRRSDNRHAVFFTEPRETVDYHYERNPADPRITHALTLDVDEFGNVVKSVSVGYGRRQPDPTLPATDRSKQTQTLVTYSENRVTNSIQEDDAYRTPGGWQSRTYELTGFPTSPGAWRFTIDDFITAGADGIHLRFDHEIAYQDQPAAGRTRRLIEHVRTLFRSNDLAGPLPPATQQSMALPYESYKLAFTPGLIAEVYGGRVTDAMLRDDGCYVDADGEGNWWIPSGQVFYSPNIYDTAPPELAYALQHFFLPHLFRDAFGEITTVIYDRYDLLVQETRDPLDNRVTAGERDQRTGTVTPAIDYRVLQPALLMDPNRNRSAVAFDAIGMVVGTAVMGKPEEHVGDSLDGFDPDLTDAVVAAHFLDPLANPHDILGRASTRLVYDLLAYESTQGDAEPQAAVAYTLARETHDADLAPGELTRIQHKFSYSDGFGREIQKKIQAEPGPLVEGGPAIDPRWVGTGWTIFNNKGKPVRQYEPFFSDTHRFEFAKIVGVSSVLFYDPVERVVATLHPNHTYEKVIVDPWRQETWDVSDTATRPPQDDEEVKGFFLYPDGTPRLPSAEYLPTWLALRADPAYAAEAIQRWPDSKIRDAEKAAAEKSAVHAETPSVAHADSLGRVFLTVAHNRFKYRAADPVVEEFYRTRVVFDIEGNQREVVDAKDRIVMHYDYDMLGNRVHQASMEAGARWTLNDVAGKPIRAWDSRSHQFRTVYDPLRRPIESYMRDGAGPELLVGRTVYGETGPDPETRNLRGEVVQLFDQAGVVTTDDYDFKGNLQSSQRQLAQAYKTTVDWSATATPPLEAPRYTSRTRYDALNRPTELTAPDTSVIRPTYNLANLLERIEANLRGAAVATPFIANIDYNEKGQRRLIEYGNGVRTTYDYDPLTFRLVHLLTRRDAVAFPDDCPQPPPPAWPGCQVQNLHYTYDPAGNITRIRDDAQQAIYFRNTRVEPSADYAYDAIYRLIKATGREHLGQVGGAPIPQSYNDAPRVGLLHPGDGNAMCAYDERYLYDAAGNFLEMKHERRDAQVHGWTRSYAYAETSLIEDGSGGALLKASNRLSSTTVNMNGNNPVVDPYLHDAHGNMIRMPHLSAQPDLNMHWDYRDQLRRTDLGGGGTAYYAYDAAGQRVRKVWEKSANLIEERIYLGGFEIFRRRNGARAVTLERETLHVMDDKQRIAVVETRTLDTAGNDPAPPQLIRYQFANHLGSASLELDHQAQIISYEEYTPYGSTSYQAVRVGVEVSSKRYRYTGKERDEESGLYYHGARYYAPWMGKWTSTDRSGPEGGINLYAFVQQNPIKLTDPTGFKPKSTDGVAATAGAGGEIPVSDNKTLSDYLIDNAPDGVSETWKARQAKVDAASITHTLQAPTGYDRPANLSLEGTYTTPAGEKKLAWEQVTFARDLSMNLLFLADALPSLEAGAVGLIELSRVVASEGPGAAVNLLKELLFIGTSQPNVATVATDVKDVATVVSDVKNVATLVTDEPLIANASARGEPYLPPAGRARQLMDIVADKLGPSIKGRAAVDVRDIRLPNGDVVRLVGFHAQRGEVDKVAKVLSENLIFGESGSGGSYVLHAEDVNLEETMNLQGDVLGQGSYPKQCTQCQLTSSRLGLEPSRNPRLH